MRLACNRVVTKGNRHGSSLGQSMKLGLDSLYMQVGKTKPNNTGGFNYQLHISFYSPSVADIYWSSGPFSHFIRSYPKGLFRVG